jgi:hypothetical protein
MRSFLGGERSFIDNQEVTDGEREGEGGGQRLLRTVLMHT